MNKMLVALLVLATVGTLCVMEVKTAEAVCSCPFLHAPVCGTDGATYVNQCVAHCNGVQVICSGECPCGTL